MKQQEPSPPGDQNLLEKRVTQATKKRMAERAEAQRRLNAYHDASKRKTHDQNQSAGDAEGLGANLRQPEQSEEPIYLPVIQSKQRHVQMRANELYSSAVVSKPLGRAHNLNEDLGMAVGGIYLMNGGKQHRYSPLAQQVVASDRDRKGRYTRLKGQSIDGRPLAGKVRLKSSRPRDVMDIQVALHATAIFNVEQAIKYEHIREEDLRAQR